MHYGTGINLAARIEWISWSYHNFSDQSNTIHYHIACHVSLRSETLPAVYKNAAMSKGKDTPNNVSTAFAMAALAVRAGASEAGLGVLESTVEVESLRVVVCPSF